MYIHTPSSASKSSVTGAFSAHRPQMSSFSQSETHRGLNNVRYMYGVNFPATLEAQHRLSVVKGRL